MKTHLDHSRSAHSPARSWLRRRASPSLPRRWRLAAFATALIAPSTAFAIEAGPCDLACPQGFVCELAPVACPAISCLDANDPSCPRCDAEPEPYCAPAPCDSDDDCGGGTVCAEHTAFVDCPVSAPTPEPSSETKAAADPPEATECMPSTIRECTPRWQLPCTTANDCGDGFRCEEQQSCSVPGAADPDARDRAASAEVTCEPSGVFACVVIETPCATDAECPAQFICADNPNATCDASYDRPACIIDVAKLCIPETTAFANDSMGRVSTVLPASEESGRTETHANDADASASAGSCAMSSVRTPASVPALCSTLGLAALFALRRRHSAPR